MIDFIGIGSGKSGSTWLFENIRKHPEICDKNPKEIQFFNLHYNKGLSWYKKQFKDCENMLKGEFSIQYMSCSKCAKRILKFNPNIKLIAILRNPVNRIFSDYQHSIRKAEIPPTITFYEYIQDENRLKYGLYYDELLPFYKLFPEKNIKILILEEVQFNPEKNLKEIYKFLELSNPEYIPANINEKVNQSMEYKILLLENIITNISKFLNRIGMTLLVEKIKQSGLPQLIRKINCKGVSQKKIDERSKQYLQNYYKESNKKLSKLIKKDLKVWTQ